MEEKIIEKNQAIPSVELAPEEPLPEDFIQLAHSFNSNFETQGLSSEFISQIEAIFSHLIDSENEKARKAKVSELINAGVSKTLLKLLHKDYRQMDPGAHNYAVRLMYNFSCYNCSAFVKLQDHSFLDNFSDILLNPPNSEILERTLSIVFLCVEESKEVKKKVVEADWLELFVKKDIPVEKRLPQTVVYFCRLCYDLLLGPQFPSLEKGRLIIDAVFSKIGYYPRKSKLVNDFYHCCHQFLEVKDSKPWARINHFTGSPEFKQFIRSRIMNPTKSEYSEYILNNQLLILDNLVDGGVEMHLLDLFDESLMQVIFFFFEAFFFFFNFLTIMFSIRN